MIKDRVNKMGTIIGVKELIPQRIVMRIRVNVHEAFSTLPSTH